VKIEYVEVQIMQVLKKHQQLTYVRVGHQQHRVEIDRGYGNVIDYTDEKKVKNVKLNYLHQ
jgi:hypothetical protein